MSIVSLDEHYVGRSALGPSSQLGRTIDSKTREEAEWETSIQREGISPFVRFS